MIVELFEKHDALYIKGIDGVDWHVCSKGIGDNFVEFTDNRVHGTVIPNALEPQEIVELSKSGIRADELIRLRQAGVL